MKKKRKHIADQLEFTWSGPAGEVRFIKIENPMFKYDHRGNPEPTSACSYELEMHAADWRNNGPIGLMHGPRAIHRKPKSWFKNRDLTFRPIIQEMMWKLPIQKNWNASFLRWHF